MSPLFLASFLSVSNINSLNPKPTIPHTQLLAKGQNQRLFFFSESLSLISEESFLKFAMHGNDITNTVTYLV